MTGLIDVGFKDERVRKLIIEMQPNLKYTIRTGNKEKQNVSSTDDQRICGIVENILLVCLLDS